MQHISVLNKCLIIGEGLPKGVDFDNKFIYYVGPVDAVDDEVIGPAGQPLATRMDCFTDMMLERPAF